MESIQLSSLAVTGGTALTHEHSKPALAAAKDRMRYDSAVSVSVTTCSACVVPTCVQSHGLPCPRIRGLLLHHHSGETGSNVLNSTDIESQTANTSTWQWATDFQDRARISLLRSTTIQRLLRSCCGSLRPRSLNRLLSSVPWNTCTDPRLLQAKHSGYRVVIAFGLASSMQGCQSGLQARPASDTSTGGRADASTSFAWASLL